MAVTSVFVPRWVPVPSCLFGRLYNISRFIWPTLLSNYFYPSGWNYVQVLCASSKNGVSTSWPSGSSLSKPCCLQAKHCQSSPNWFRTPCLGSLIGRGSILPPLRRTYWNCNYSSIYKYPTESLGFDYTVNLLLLTCLLVVPSSYL